MNYRARFTGSGTEYAAIWIVNVLFTILTLGLYYPWAKVRTQRYLHGNTFIDGDTFEYHATGKQIFGGFIIAWTLLVIYIILDLTLPAAASTMFFVVSIAVLPWLIFLSIQFNLKMKSYRNVRFGFNGSVWEGYLVYGIYPLVISLVIFGVAGFIANLYSRIGFNLVTLVVTLMSFAIVMALKNYLSSCFFVNNATFGNEKFSAKLEKNEYIKYHAIAIGSAFLMFTAIGYFVSTTSLNNIYSLEQIQSQAPTIIAVSSMLLITFFIYRAVITTLERNYLVSRIQFIQDIRFSSDLNVITLLWIYLSNYLMIVATLGLATPWAKIRLVSYLVGSFGINTTEKVDQISGKSKQNSDPLGDQVSEAFEVDVGGTIGF